MTISILADGIEILEKHVQFSDGGSNIKIKTGLNPKRIVVTIKDEPVDNYVYLLGITIRLLRCYYAGVRRTCYLPYLPHGRADRSFEDGMVTPLTSIEYVINSFDEVILRDPHSGFLKESMSQYEHDVKYTEISQLQSFLDCPFDTSRYNFDTLIAPDEGAKDKTREFADYFMRNMIHCDKDRDVTTGYINGIKVYGNVKDRHCLIVDDICDGGATFLLTAKALKDQGASNVNLYVTHGIFSKGLDIFRGIVSNIYCFHTVMDYVTMADIHKFNEENSK